jgi:hypothetical protein
VFAVVPKVTKDGTRCVVKDSGVVYSWGLFTAAFCVIAFLYAMWLFAPYGGVPQVWIGTLGGLVILLYAGAASYSNVWRIDGANAEVRRKVLGVTFARESVSDLRLREYVAVVGYRGMSGGGEPFSQLKDRGDVLVVLDSPRRFVVLMMSNSESVDSYKGWSGERYSDVLGLPLELGEPIVAKNAW